MPYDPKRIYEDRTPEPNRDAPRGVGGHGLSFSAHAAGSCVQCGKPYRAGDDVVTNDRSTTALETRGPFYHRDCWDRTHEKHLLPSWLRAWIRK